MSRSYLQSALESKDVKQLQQITTDLDVANAQGDPSLHAVLRWEESEARSLAMISLLKNGASPDQLSAQKRTPLHMAALNGQISMARLLVAFKASIDSVDSSRRTPLFYAAISPHENALSLITLLIGWGASLTHLDKRDLTAAEQAARAKRTENFKKLEAAKAKMLADQKTAVRVSPALRSQVFSLRLADSGESSALQEDLERSSSLQHFASLSSLS